MSRHFFTLALFAGAAALAGCGAKDEPTVVVPPKTGLSIIGGAAGTDTINAVLLQALLVEVRDPRGAPVAGVDVEFETRPPADSLRARETAVYVCNVTYYRCGPLPAGQITTAPISYASDTTDAQGRARVLVQLGQVVGKAIVSVTVPSLRLADSASFTVQTGAPVRIWQPSISPAIGIGDTTIIRARTADRGNNIRSDAVSVTTGAGSAFSFDAATGTAIGRAFGSQWLFARFGTLSDSVPVAVVPQGRLVVSDASARAIWLVNTTGTALRRLLSNVGSDLGSFPRFDPARQRVTVHTAGSSGFGVPDAVIVIDSVGGQRRDIGPASGFRSIALTKSLADGSVYTVGFRSPATGTASISRINADNTITLVRTVPGLELVYGSLDFSPDGSKLAYIGQSSNSQYGLHVLTLATGSVAELTTAPSARSPRWSPDGLRITYLENQVGPNTTGIDGLLNIINADGTGRRTLGTDVYEPGLTWSPDGAYLLGRSARLLRMIRVSDGLVVPMMLRDVHGGVADYYQPDWR